MFVIYNRTFFPFLRSFCLTLPVRLIVDLNHLAYRNWAANGTLATSGGELTGAIYGTLKSIIALSEQFKPAQMIATRDSVHSFRRSIYPAYKANRLKENLSPEKARARENFECQLAKTERILSYLGVPILGIDEFEADDLAALIAEGIPFSGATILVSGDRDFVQLVRPGVRLLSPLIPTRGKLLAHDGPEYDGNDQGQWRRLFEVGPKTFTRWVEKLPRGIALAQWLLYRVVVGDSSDNLAGVPGIGPCAGLKVVERFSSFDELLCASPTQWAQALNQMQVEALAQAVQSGDLAKQYQIINLGALARTEGAAELIGYLARNLEAIDPDEKAARDLLVHWEMGSLLIAWKKLLTAFPAFR